MKNFRTENDKRMKARGSGRERVQHQDFLYLMSQHPRAHSCSPDLIHIFYTILNKLNAG